MTAPLISYKSCRTAGAALAALLALGVSSVRAETLKIVDAASLSKIGRLNFSGGTGADVSTGDAYLGSYKLSNNEWVYCLSPLTDSNIGTNYNFNKVTLSTFLTGGGYHDQFQLTSPDYQHRAPGYSEQPAATVLDKILELYNYAYKDTLGNAAKSAAFAYALWEIEGESVPYGTNTGGLRLGGSAAGDSAVTNYASQLFSGLSTHNWSGLTIHDYQAYNFNVYQASPIESSQSFLVVSEVTGSFNSFGAQIPEPSTGMLLAASALALLGSRRVARGKAAPVAA
jgi:hypothetical protein